ncbi:MAG: OmpA family protein [Sulfitobacter sp.]
MKHSMRTALVTFSMGLALLTAPAFVTMAQAQDLSVEEMTANFKKQKTRGLTIATPSTTETTGATATTGTTAAVVATVPEPTMVVPKEEQVNVNVSFDFDSAALRADQRPKLAALCTALKAADVKKIRILGHTDASGSDEYNERLSKLRAEEVKRYLVTDCGYPAERMDAQGVGERFPFDENNPRADVNRRVEFQALS